MADWGTGEAVSAPFDGVDGEGAAQANGWTDQNNNEGTEAPRKPRVRKGDIEKLKADRAEQKEKLISIWTRRGKDEPHMPLNEKFSGNAAMLFSEVWKKKLNKESKNGGIYGALILEDIDIESCKRILNWINLCVDEGNDIKFPEIEDENPLEVLIDIVTTADHIKVPEMSLQDHLKKSAIRYARKALIGIDYVERLYDEAHELYIGDPTLQEAGAASIFEAWWTRQLDGPEYDDYCSFLEQMRAEFPKLDDDLNGRFDEKKAFLQKKREERKSGLRGGGGNNYANGNTTSASEYGKKDDVDGGWGDAAASTGDATGEWGVSGNADIVDTAGGW